jgi:GAF domain-containing protein
VATVEPIPETEEVLKELLTLGDTEAAGALLQMGRSATEIVPECVGLSLGLLEDGLTFTLVASSDEIAALDAVQYLDGGPCVSAAHEAETIEADPTDLTDEERWQLYARASAASGVRSSLTLPILRQGRVMGSVNLYAATADAFEGKHQALAAALGGSAEAAVANADLSFRTRLEAMEAPGRLSDQNDVDIALGIISASQGVDISTAAERLQQAAARAGISEGQAARALRQILLT